MLSSLLQHLLKLVDLILSWFVQGVNNKAKPTHSKRVTNSPRQSPTEICKTFAHGKQDKKTETMKMDYLTYSKRLEYLLESIEKGWINTPKQVCEKFNCSDKTARNMINRLREMGHCIEYCKVFRKYYLKIE